MGSLCLNPRLMQGRNLAINSMIEVKPIEKQRKLICVVGPTASGKSELAVAIAKAVNGEIISCDSRQVYTNMNIGTGKVAGNWKKLPISRHLERSANHVAKGSLKPVFIYKNIPHHCIDFVDPKKQFSVSLFQETAFPALDSIESRNKLPILCGGTGQWLEAVAYNQKLPEVKPNQKLRKTLEKLSVEELLEKLKQLDPDRAAVIDWHNKRRLVRALEIVTATGQPVPKLELDPNSNILWIGLYPGQDELHKKIDVRLKDRLKQGLVSEVHNLKKSGLSWKKLEDFGLEYKFIALHLQKKLSKQELLEQLPIAIKQYAKRQMTWFRRNENIIWVQDPKNAMEYVKKFIV